MPEEAENKITTTAVLELLDEMIVQQRAKCLKIARRLNPHLTPDDLMNCFDWPELSQNPQYVWEDGTAAGLEAAHAAVSRQFRNPDPNYKVRRFETDETE